MQWPDNPPSAFPAAPIHVHVSSSEEPAVLLTISCAHQTRRKITTASSPARSLRATRNAGHGPSEMPAIHGTRRARDVIIEVSSEYLKKSIWAAKRRTLKRCTMHEYREKFVCFRSNYSVSKLDEPFGEAL